MERNRIAGGSFVPGNRRRAHRLCLDAQAIDEFVVSVAPVFPQYSLRMAFH
jgi:hypothetical protein